MTGPCHAPVRSVGPATAGPPADPHRSTSSPVHDGFTLYDLVSYNHKHNEANGEGNRDGTDDNCSWNCGVEGRPTIPTSSRCAARQARNLLATLLLSQGVPMLLAATSSCRPRAATTTPGARTTTSAGSTGRWPATTATSPDSSPAWSGCV